jgi:hypothetical protein
MYVLTGGFCFQIVVGRRTHKVKADDDRRLIASRTDML